MAWQISLILSVVFTYAIAQSRENGILYDHTNSQLRQWDPQIMRSNNYPKPAPHDLVQTWSYLGVQRSGETIALQIICNRLFAAKDPNSNGCGKYKITISDGDKAEDICGEVERFQRISSTNMIKFELRTGPNGGGLVDCTVQAVPVTSDRVVMTTSTTTTTTTPPPTRPTLPPYVNIESEEVDSSEDGGTAGVKKTSCPCGWANKVQSRIVNGTETKKNEFPFAAGLVLTIPNKKKQRICGAVIITRYHAVTAAHCTEGIPSSYLTLYVGAHNVIGELDEGTEEIPIFRTEQHPEYNRTIWKHDITLLVMDKEIKFSQYVGPACLLPPTQKLNIDRQYVKILGWGATFDGGPQNAVLNKVNVRIVPMKECNYVYPIVNRDNPTQICTYATNKASCQGDSGGPVVWVDPDTNRYTLIGLVSFARVCADHYPTVHTSIQAYSDWLHNLLKVTNMPDTKTCKKIN